MLSSTKPTLLGAPSLSVWASRSCQVVSNVLSRHSARGYGGGSSTGHARYQKLKLQAAWNCAANARWRERAPGPSGASPPCLKNSASRVFPGGVDDPQTRPPPHPRKLEL